MLLLNHLKKFSLPSQAGFDRRSIETCGELQDSPWMFLRHVCKQNWAAFFSIFGSSAKFSGPALILGPSAPFVGAGSPAGAILRKRRIGAFSLIETTVALGLVGIFFSAALAAIVTNQVCDRKAKEDAIAMDFLTKYVENIKAQPFTSIAPGMPINSIYNGVGGAPLIAIPATNSPVSLNTTAFQTFYPDLVWLTNLNPTMTVALTQNSVNGALHDIEINAKVDWTAPLAKGGQMEVQVDFYRTVDAPKL
jgi:hypothetical protein